jgi:hypothetical protein
MMDMNKRNVMMMLTFRPLTQNNDNTLNHVAPKSVIIVIGQTIDIIFSFDVGLICGSSIVFAAQILK